jgi:hypothetical protein
MIGDIHFPEDSMEYLIAEYEKLGAMINKFIRYVEEKWRN